MKWRKWAVLVTVVLTVILVGSMAMWLYVSRTTFHYPPAATPTPNTGVIPVQYSGIVDVPSGTTPTPSVLPDTAAAVLANFYASYSRWDEERLLLLFTADQTTADTATRARILKAGLLEVASNYSLMNSAPSGQNWVITVKEKRVSATGGATNDVVSIITLEAQKDPSNGPWLISSYLRSGSSGKYSGFLIQ
jgi:hypothetical protein